MGFKKARLTNHKEFNGVNTTQPYYRFPAFIDTIEATGLNRTVSRSESPINFFYLAYITHIFSKIAYFMSHSLYRLDLTQF